MIRPETLRPTGVALLAVLGALGAVLPALTSAATLSIPSNSAPANASVDMCVVLTGGEQRLAGVQANILLDARCANVVRGSGNSAECSVGPAAAETGKQLTTVIGGTMCNNSPNCVRAILVAFDNTDPIPDGTLFCCAFTIPSSAPDGDCLFQLAQVRGSTSNGQPILDIAARPGVLVVSGGSSRSSGSGGVGGPLSGAPPVAVGGGGSAPPAPEAAAAAPAPPAQKAAPAAAPQKPQTPPTAAPAPDAAETPVAAGPPGDAVAAAGEVAATAPTPAAQLPPALPPRTAAARPEVTPGGTTVAAPSPTTPLPAAAAVAETPTPAAPTHSPTHAMPTTTPTAAGWFSGCHVRR